MRFGAALRHLLRRQRFRQLFAVRVTSQFSDGVFQVALASYVLFSPERQPDAASIAAALAMDAGVAVGIQPAYRQHTARSPIPRFRA